MVGLAQPHSSWWSPTQPTNSLDHPVETHRIGSLFDHVIRMGFRSVGHMPRNVGTANLMSGNVVGLSRTDWDNNLTIHEIDGCGTCEPGFPEFIGLGRFLPCACNKQIGDKIILRQSFMPLTKFGGAGSKNRSTRRNQIEMACSRPLPLKSVKPTLGSRASPRKRFGSLGARL